MKSEFVILGVLGLLLVFTFAGAGQVESTITGNSITGVFATPEKPKQLFDITFNLEDRFLLDSSELVTVTTFESFGSEPTPVNLTYIVMDSEGEIVYTESDSIVVETENFIRKDFEGLNLDFGEYRIFLETLYSDGVQDFFEREFEVKSKIANSDKQLFDIRFELDSKAIERTGQLFARVIFESFGSEPTPVDIDFKILDEEGNLIYRADDSIIVETEQIYNKAFGVSNFPEGSYRVVLTTLYNVDVEDEFVRKFRIGHVGYSVWMFWVSVVFNLLLVFGLVYSLRKNLGRKK